MEPKSPGSSTSGAAVIRAGSTLVLVVLSTCGLLALRPFLELRAPAWTPHRWLDVQIAYQVCALGAAFCVLQVGRAGGSSARFLRWGHLSTPAEPISILGVRRGEPWRAVVRNFSLIAGLVTAVVVWLQVAAGVPGASGDLLAALGPSLLLACANALWEELLFRVAVLEATVDLWGKTRSTWLSGVLFGLLHYAGSPGGLPGVLLAGFLGVILARSVVETRGWGGAWVVHFVQDVLIFTITFAAWLAQTGPS